VLLVVSPLTRTLLTGSLLFHRLLDRGVTIKVVIEPACVEVINAPHDIVENLGRAPAEAFGEALAVLQAHDAPDSAVALLKRMEEAAKTLEANWWFKPLGPDNLPRRVLDSESSKRKACIRKQLKSHIAECGPCTRVYIVGHWGVLRTLTGEAHAKNLECRALDGFLSDSEV